MLLTIIVRCVDNTWVWHQSRSGGGQASYCNGDILVFVFTARCYAYRGIYCRKMSVCPSVCHTPVSCRNGSTCHQTFLNIGYTRLCLQYERLWQYSKGDSPDGGVEYSGM